MRLDRTKYLELVIHHKDFTLYEYPSRFCIIRIPFDKINFSNFTAFDLSLGQLRKLFRVGLKAGVRSDLYRIVGHRPFDRSFISQYPEFEDKFYLSLYTLFEKYWEYFG